MYQILSLREKWSEKKKKMTKVDYIHFESNWRFASIPEMFKNIASIIETIPVDDRWNLYFTANNCKDKKREFYALECMTFDIDGCDLNRKDEYIAALCTRLSVPREKIGILCSGNGLQFFVQLKTPIYDPKFFQNNRLYYKALCDVLDKDFADANLSGHLDPSVFDESRLMRLPNTENRKAHGSKQSYIINAEFEAYDINLQAIAGVPEVEAKDQVSLKNFKQFFSIDEKAMLGGCEFLKEMVTDPKDFHEPQLYAAFSFLAQMEDKERRALHVARRCTSSPTIMSYTDEEIIEKLNQAEMASGPRTCENINSLWGKCHTCPHYKKLNSPIGIHAPDFIKTAKTGFYNFVIDPITGMGKKTTPNYEDLEKHFVKKVGPFKSQAKTVWGFEKTHYVEISNDELLNFAHTHFDPKPLSQQREEFKNWMTAARIAKDSFWLSARKKINFQNGVLDLEDKKLKDHSSNIGFRYCLPYSYDPDADAPIFNVFLDTVTKGSEDLKNILLEFMGYCIAGDEPWAAKMLVLTGDGRNGKSTFMNVLKALVGTDNYSTLSLQFLKNPERRSCLEKMLFNICEEAPKFMGDSSDIKALSAGDEITARKLYKEGFSFRNIAKLIFSCNALPQSEDHAYGYYERFLIVPFDRTFLPGERDPNIFKKLQKELPGILNMALDAYERLVDRGAFVVADRSIEELEHYKKENDSFMSWYEALVSIGEKDSAKRIALKALYGSYAEYCERFGFNKHRDVLNFEVFQKRIRRVVPDYGTRRTKSGSTRFLSGVEIRGSEADF